MGVPLDWTAAVASLFRRVIMRLWHTGIIDPLASGFGSRDAEPLA